MHAPLALTLFSCAVLGFRHGLDYDHIAAITDITSLPRRVSVSMRLGLSYALGHATTVALLGAAVILFQLSLPRHLDALSERLVGITLILLAVYVIGGLLRGNRDTLPPSRAALILGAVRRLQRSMRRNPPHARMRSRADQSTDYSSPAAFGIGVIHGLGAETPTQLALFLLAANLGGPERAISGMGMFIAGLVLMNTLMTATAAGVFHRARPHPRTMRWVAGLTAAYSLVVGCVFMLGGAGVLPALS